MRQFFFYVGLIFFGLISPTFAAYPGTQWSSERLHETIFSVRVGTIIEGQINLATLSPHKIVLYQKVEGALSKLSEYSDSSDLFKLSLMDSDGDGVDELVVSSSSHGRLESFILKVVNGKWTRVLTRPGYLSVIFWDGQKKLVAQKGLGTNAFAGPLVPLSYEGGKWIEKESLKLPGGLSGESPSLFSMAGVSIVDKNYWVILKEGGELGVYDRPTVQQIWSSSERYSGAIHEVAREVKEFLSATRATNLLVPPSFLMCEVKDPTPPADPYAPEPPVTDRLRLFLVKNTGYLKDVVGAHPTIKSSQLVSLVWTGYGWQEKWSSPSYDGALSDFDRIDWDGDGRPEIVAALWLRDKGFVDTLKQQDSLIVVIRPQNP